MSMMKEFKEFTMKGSVVDLAVGVIIGGAFGKIVDSLVNDVLMPPIGMALGNIDFKNLALKLSDAGADGKPVMMNYGLFINHVITFIIVAFCVFMIIKVINAARRKEEKVPAAPAPTPQNEILLAEIRDLLKKG